MGHEGEGKHRLGKCWELKWADVAVLFRYCFFIFLFFCCDCFIGGCPCRAVKSGWAGLAIGTGTLLWSNCSFSPSHGCRVAHKGVTSGHMYIGSGLWFRTKDDYKKKIE